MLYLQKENNVDNTGIIVYVFEYQEILQVDISQKKKSCSRTNMCY